MKSSEGSWEEVCLNKIKSFIGWAYGLIMKLFENDVIRYVFFGGCTTMVNLVCFYVLRRLGMGLTTANVISIFLAIVFAYVVNSRYVFRDDAKGFAQHLQKFGKFFGGRLSTMVIEVGGVWLLVEKIGLMDMVGKFLIQIIVLILNYIISKFFVFRKKVRD